MAKIDIRIPDLLKGLEKKELEKLVVLAAKKNKEFHDHILINYTDRKDAEQDLFDEALKDINFLRMKSYKGFSKELQYANLLAACHKRINQFEKTSKNKPLTMDLILHVLEPPFSFSAATFHTCFTNYNYRVALLVKKAVTLYKKLHNDVQSDYTDTLSKYLTILKRESRHLDFVYNMPEKC